MTRILNCKRGSFAWFHEQRHTQQEKSWQLLSKWCVFDELFKMLAVVSVVFQQWLLVSIFVVGLFAFDFSLEFDADWYALRKTGNWKAWFRLGDL